MWFHVIRHLIVVCSLHNVFIAAFLMKMVHGGISNFLVCLVLWRHYKTAQACNVLSSVSFVFAESQKYTYIQPIQDTRHTSTPTHQQAQHTHKDCWNMSDKIKQYVLKAKQTLNIEMLAMSWWTLCYNAVRKQGPLRRDSWPLYNLWKHKTGRALWMHCLYQCAHNLCQKNVCRARISMHPETCFPEYKHMCQFVLTASTIRCVFHVL